MVDHDGRKGESSIIATPSSPNFTATGFLAFPGSDLSILQFGACPVRERRSTHSRLPLAILFVVGFAMIVNEEIFKGVDAFTLHPSDE
jgi:hypothetical protein